MEVSIEHGAGQPVAPGNVVHGNYAQLRAALELCAVGSRVTCDASIEPGIRVVAGRLKIRTAQRRSEDGRTIAITRIA